MSRYEQVCDGLFNQALRDWEPGMDVDAAVERMAGVLREEHPTLSDRAFNGILAAYRQGFTDAETDWNAPSAIVLNR